MQRIVDVGVIDPACLTRDQNYTLWAFINALNPAADSVLLPGRYFFATENQCGDPVDCEFKLKSSFVYRGTLDPSHSSVKLNLVMSQFLLKARFDKFIQPGCYCQPFNDGIQSAKLELYILKYGISARHKFDQTFCFDFIDQLYGCVGKGAYGRIYTLFGSLKPKYSIFGALKFSPGEDKRVAKLQALITPVTDRKLRMIEAENSLMSRVKYLKPRDFKYFGAGNLNSYLTMRKIKGVNLQSVLQNDEKKINELSVYDRLSISISLIRELHLHFLGNNILHRDIKPENIMVEKLAGHSFWSVKFIDLGLSADSVQDSYALREAVGTPLYMAPELFDEAYNQLSDVYSLGRVIALLWRDREFERYDGMDQKQFVRLRASQTKIEFNMFEGIDVNCLIKDYLLETIRSMTNRQRYMRPDLKALIVTFENIRLSYYQSMIDDIHRQKSLFEAKRTAVTLREYLTSVYKATTVEVTLADFRRTITTAIKQLSDDPIAVRLFIDVVGIRCLYQCEDKISMLAVVNYIILTFTDMYDDWWGKLDRLQEYYNIISVTDPTYSQTKMQQLKQFLRYSELFLKKITSDLFDLDFLIELNQRMLRKIEGIDDACNFFCGDNAELETSLTKGANSRMN